MQTFISATETDGGNPQTTVRPDGSSVVNVEASGQTLQSNVVDTFLNHGAPDTTFVFEPNRGLDVVRQFRVDGTDHDTIGLASADFAGSIAEVLRNTRNAAGGGLIVDPTTGDTVKLVGISEAQLVHDRGDFAVHA